MPSSGYSSWPAPGHRAVLFDMDGVLIDSFRAHWRSWRETGARRGFDITEDLFRASFGRGNRETIPAYGGGHYTPEEMDAWADEKETAFLHGLSDEFPAMPGASRLIRDLHEAGWRLGVASSGYRPVVEAVRNLLPEGWRFHTLVTYHDIVRGKPDPEVFWRCAAGLATPPERCVVIEDSLPGLAAARAAGMRALAVTGTAPREELARNAARVIDRFDEVDAESLAALLSSPAA